MQDLPISLDVNEGPLTEPEWILQCQTIQCQNQSVSQLLVKWKGQAMEEATWIDELDLEGQFPEFKFKDKVTS
uniref:Chromo domain-containing protein n=1 Tax=Manihot esculenta TaxID=3983 RepID=A0A199UAG4_MANES